ncbi:MAG: hypothetical protein HY646_05575 [Acidobacteria bacterium]|nr:hypothetical protein [Acidobacteriota bacterium]
MNTDVDMRFDRRMWSVGKDAGWMLVMGIVCIATFAVSSFVLKYGHWNRP